MQGIFILSKSDRGDMELQPVSISDIAEAVAEALWEKRQGPGQAKGNEPEEDLLTIPQICRLFDISRTTVHHWKKAGMLPFYRLGARVYFKREEVLGAMEKANNKRRG